MCCFVVYSTAKMPFIARCSARVHKTYAPRFASLASRHLLGAESSILKLRFNLLALSFDHDEWLRGLVDGEYRIHRKPPVLVSQNVHSAPRFLASCDLLGAESSILKLRFNLLALSFDHDGCASWIIRRRISHSSEAFGARVHITVHSAPRFLASCDLLGAESSILK